MEYLPVFIKLEHSPCLVVGGGAVAERKVRLLRRAKARVTVVAPKLLPALAALRERGLIEHDEREFEPSLVLHYRLVVAATDDRAANAGVARAAEEAGILCNAVDDAASSTFVFPAIVDRDPVLVAIGTGGAAPVLAQRLKTQLEALLPARLGRLAERAGRLRATVKRRFGKLEERRRFWQRYFDGPIAAGILGNREREADRLIRRELIRDAAPAEDETGEAWIVGAGPGDPGLVTLRALQLLSQADVVLYDRLVSRAVLDYARKEAELVPVGKRAGSATMSQQEINELLVALVRQGKRVCRLKGGDPFVFGRGGEEVQALSAAGLPYQVVPGISAALGCAAYAGIPLTMRGLSSSVTLATARLDPSSSPDWAALARGGQTLALYMSAGGVAETAGRLLAEGMARHTPVAMVERGTTSRQRVLHSTLSTIGRDAAAAGIEAPAMFFAGPSVALGRELQWFGGDESAAGFAGDEEFDRFGELPAGA